MVGVLVYNYNDKGWIITDDVQLYKVNTNWFYNLDPFLIY